MITNARMHECTDARMHGCTDARMHGCTNARRPERKKAERQNRWMRRVNTALHSCIPASRHCCLVPSCLPASRRRAALPAVNAPPRRSLAGARALHQQHQRDDDDEDDPEQLEQTDERHDRCLPLHHPEQRGVRAVRGGDDVGAGRHEGAAHLDEERLRRRIHGRDVRAVQRRGCLRLTWRAAYR